MIELEERLVGEVEPIFAEFFSDGIDDQEVHNIALEFVDRSYKFRPKAEDLFGKLEGGRPKYFVVFDVIEAAKFIAGLITIISAPANPWAFGAGIFATILGAVNIVDTLTPAESLLVWALYSLEGHTGTYDTLKDAFTQLSKNEAGIDESDFSSVLNDLQSSNIIASQDGLFSINPSPVKVA